MCPCDSELEVRHAKGSGVVRDGQMTLSEGGRRWLFVPDNCPLDHPHIRQCLRAPTNAHGSLSHLARVIFVLQS
jgi:hypothetical protein